MKIQLYCILIGMEVCVHFSSICSKMRKPERRLAWPLYKDDSQIGLIRSPTLVDMMYHFTPKSHTSLQVLGK